MGARSAVRCTRRSACLLVVAMAAADPGLAVEKGATPQAAVEGEGSVGVVQQARTTLLPFDTAPFPYRGSIPGQDKPFLDVDQGGRRGHTSPRGGVYFEDKTYSDRRVLLSIPRGFDPGRPAVVVVFLHGNEARLERDVRDRQQVVRQLADSDLNAVLVAPQFAVDALDSSAGRFWEPGHFAKFLGEAAEKLAVVHGDERSRQVFARAPVVVVAYSGGYLPAAFALQVGGAGQRLLGVVLLDGLYGEEDRFAEWLQRRQQAFFFSAYSPSAREPNMRVQKLIADRGVTWQTGLPAQFQPGAVHFLATGAAAVHRDFVTRAWVADPLKVALAHIPGFPRSARGQAVEARAAEPAPAATGGILWQKTDHGSIGDFLSRFGTAEPAPETSTAATPATGAGKPKGP